MTTIAGIDLVRVNGGLRAPLHASNVAKAFNATKKVAIAFLAGAGFKTIVDSFQDAGTNPYGDPR